MSDDEPRSAFDSLIEAIEDPASDWGAIFSPPRLLDALTEDIATTPLSLRIDDVELRRQADLVTSGETLNPATVAEAPRSAAVAIRIARLLVPDHGLDVDVELQRIVSLIEESRVVAAEGAGAISSDLARSVPAGDPLRHLLERLQFQPSRPAVALTAALAIHLSGRRSSVPSRNRVTVSAVLVEAGDEVFKTEGHAFTALLELVEVPDGPVGAFPDPATMYGLHTPSRQLADAIERAREVVDPERQRSLRWSLTSKDSPELAIAGPSLAAGWAVAGLELVARKRHRPRLRTVSSRTAITGDVEFDGTLARVDHIASKAARAKDDGRIGFIYPNVAGVDLSGYGTSDFKVIPANNATDAHRSARTAIDRSFWVGISAVGVVLVLLIAGAIVFARQQSEQSKAQQVAAQKSRAAELYGQGIKLQPKDLRSAALVMLESYGLDPTTKTRNDLTEMLGEGTSLRRVYSAGASVRAVDVIRPSAPDDPWQVGMLDGDGVITYLDKDSGELLATTRPQDDENVVDLAANPIAPWVVVATPEGVRQIKAESTTFTPAPTLEPAACGTGDDVQVIVSQDGTRVAAGQGTTVCVWDALTGERLARLPITSLPNGRATYGTATPTQMSTQAMAFSDDGESIIVGGKGVVGVVDIDAATVELIEVPSGFDVTSIATLLSYEEGPGNTILATTSNGLYVKFGGRDDFEAVPVNNQAQIVRVDANVDGSMVGLTYEDRFVRLDRDRTYVAMEGKDAIDYAFPTGADDTDIAILDDWGAMTVIATLGQPQALLLSSSVPVHEWATAGSYGSDRGYAISDGDRAIAVVSGESVRVVDLASGDRTGRRELGQGKTLTIPSSLAEKEIKLAGLAFLDGRDGDLLVYGSTLVALDEPSTPFVRIFDGKTFEPLRDVMLPIGVGRQVTEVTQITDDELAFFDVEGRVTTFQLPTWTQKETTEINGRFPIYAVLSPSGQVLAVTNLEADADGTPVEPARGKVSFYAVPGLEPIGSPIGSPGGPAQTLHFVDDETMLVLGEDGRIYEVRSHEGAAGKVLWQVADDVTPGDAGEEILWMSPNKAGSKVVVSGPGPDETTSNVQIYETSWGTPISSLSVPSVQAQLVSFTDSEDSLVVLGEEESMTSVRFWALPSNELIDQVCQLVGSGFTREEWARLLPDLDYTERCTSPMPVPVSVNASDEPDADTEYDGFDPSDAEHVVATTGSCTDFAEITPDECITYGKEGAFAFTFDLSDEAFTDVLTRWERVGATWRSSGAMTGEIDGVEVVEPNTGDSQAVVKATPGNYVETMVFRDDEVVLYLIDSIVAGTEIEQTSAIGRGQQSNAERSAFQVSRWGWDGRKWDVRSVVPGVDRVWVDDPHVLASDGLAGVKLGRPMREVVAAINGLFINWFPDDLQPITHEWADGLSETATQPWVERAPLDLTETCWNRNLCIYGDPDDNFVGWRYGNGRSRPIGDMGSSVAAPYYLDLEPSPERAPVDSSGTPTWATGAGGGYDYAVGVVHPAGTVSGLRLGPEMDRSQMFAVRELAGVVNDKSVSWTSIDGIISFDSTVGARWTTIEDQLSLTEWSGSGPIGFGFTKKSDQTLIALGSLPGPRSGGYTMTVCDSAGTPVVTAQGPGLTRSWTVTGSGLVQAPPETTC